MAPTAATIGCRISRPQAGNGGRRPRTTGSGSSKRSPTTTSASTNAPIVTWSSARCGAPSSHATGNAGAAIPTRTCPPVSWACSRCSSAGCIPSPSSCAPRCAGSARSRASSTRGGPTSTPALASPLLVKRALGQCQAAIVYCRDLLPPEVSDDKGRAEVADAGAAAARAYESFATFLGEVADKATGDWALGEERYSALLRQKELLADDAGSLRERGRAQHSSLDTEMRALCRDAWGDEDWRTRLDTVNDDRPMTPDEMRDGYEQWTETARAFLHEHELVSFPDGEECTVEPSPPFQRPVLAVASYFQPPAMRPSLKGRFNVPYPPEGTSEQGPRGTLGRQQLRHHGHDQRPRGLPRAPLALRVAAGRCHADPPPGDHALLRRRLGSVCRAHDARAGLLHRRPRKICAISPHASSAPPASWRTRACTAAT